MSCENGHTYKTYITYNELENENNMAYRVNGSDSVFNDPCVLVGYDAKVCAVCGQNYDIHEVSRHNMGDIRRG